MSRFTAGADTSPETRFRLHSPNLDVPGEYIGGNSLTGFEITNVPPQLGFWKVTGIDSQINAAMIEGGNAATWVMNNLSPFAFGDQRFVSLGSANLIRQALGQDTRKPIDGIQAIMNRYSPVQDIQEEDRILLFKDHNFDAEVATKEWMDNPENQKFRDKIAQYTGRDIEDVLKGSRNIRHFQYLQMSELTHAQALQNMTDFDDQAGFLLESASRVTSAISNYMLTDPTFIPSVLVGPGSLKLATYAPAAAVKVARFIAPAVGMERAIKTGRALSTVLKSPKAGHKALSTYLGHRAAVSVEMGIYGGAWDTAIQHQRMTASEIVFDDPKYQEDFSWLELGMSVGITGSLGFALAGRGSKNLAETRRGAIEAAGGNPSSPLSYSFDNWAAQGLMDGAGMRVHRAAVELLGNDFDSVASYLDDAMLSAAGLHRFQIADAMEELIFAMDGEILPSVAVHRVLSDMISDSRKLKGLADDVLGGSTGNQLEQAAFAEALGTATRELPYTTSNANVLKRAIALMPNELKKQEARMLKRAKLAKPAKGNELKYWKSEAVGIKLAAQRRSLSEAEIDYMGTIMGKLESLGQKNPFDGFALNRSQRYADGSIYSPLRPTAGSSKLTQSLEKVAIERRLIKELSESKKAGKDIANELRNARSRLTRAKNTVKKLTVKESDKIVTEVGSRVREVTEKWIANPPKTKVEKFKALDEIANAVDFNDAALIEDGTMLGNIIKSWGIGSIIRVSQQGTGMNQTIRSTMSVLREIAHEFDGNKLHIGDLDPSQARVYKSMEGIRTDISVMTSELVDEYRRLHDAGKFGSSLRFLKYTKTRAEFDKKLIRHITDAELSDDVDIIAFADLWKKHAKKIGTVGEEAGLFKQLDDFFPRRWHVNNILKSPTQFRDALATHFTKGWSKSKDIHLDTLVGMDILKREVDKFGKPRWIRISDGEEVIEGIKRDQLEELFGISDDVYIKGMSTADADGLSPMQRAANSAKNNISEETFEEDARGIIRRKNHGSPRSEETRRIEESVWANSDLDEFLDWRFLNGSVGYLKSSGFRTLNTARHQKRWGIPKLTMEDTLDWIEQKVISSTDLSSDAAERKLWNAGIRTLREKLHYAEGRLPSIVDQTSSLGEWLSDVGSSLAGAIYGGGIGQTILTTEVAQMMVSRVYALDDIVRKVTDSFSGAFNTAETKELSKIMGMTVRQYKLHTLERLTGDAVYSEGFQFATWPKVIAPWIDVYDSILRKGASNVNKNSTASFFKAAASTNMTIGGMDYFTTFTRMGHIQSQLHEFGRFFKAAESSALALEKEAGNLTRIKTAAYDAAILAGKTETASVEAGGKAMKKAWIGIVRKNGFGGNWQVADKFAKAGILTPQKLAVLRRAGEATNSLKTEGWMKTLDFNEMARYTGSGSGEQEVFNEAFGGIRDIIVSTIHKRVSEQNILQTPTSKTARTSLGRIANTMTSYTRSFADNNIMDMGQMPMKASVGLLSAYLIGETMSLVTRSMWKGQDIDNVIEDIEADPDNFIARAFARLPILGAWSSLLTPVADMLTRDKRTYGIETGQSAATGATSATLDIVSDIGHGFATDSEFQSSTWRNAARFMPGYRSWWASLLVAGAEASGVPVIENLPGAKQGSRHRSRRRPRQAIGSGSDFDFKSLPRADVPEDINFLYPEIE